jgi:ComF family protein
MDCQPQWRNLVDDVWRTLQHALWPTVCLVCGAPGQAAGVDLCRGCHADLPATGAACIRCAQRLPQSVGTEPVCGRCLGRPPGFQRSFCPFAYESPIDHLIRSFKYRGNLAAGRLLARLFCERAAPRSAPLPECIVPVPLATRRYRQRGFNQALELGSHIARQLAVPLRADLVVRSRETAEQAGLKLQQRRRNVRRAFAVVRRIDARHVAILDDVMTTGSTANEVARVLRGAGVRYVEVWAVARAGAQVTGELNR